jgi:bleomycin hydrolase
MAGAPEMDFVNLPASQLKQAAMEAVLQNEPVWFAADVGVDHYGDLGILADDVYDYESIFGMDLSLSKADRIRFGLGASNHAMVFTGVDILNGEPRKWLVENSWGTEKGDQGCWTLYDSWFDENVYVVIVPKTFVSKEILAIFSEPAIELPPWYPGAVGL